MVCAGPPESYTGCHQTTVIAMEYTALGNTGTTVSRICLGCMSFGSKEWRDWVLEAEASREIIERAIDLGINFFDTANMYSLGESERILGDVLGEYDRDEQVVASKVFFQMREDDPNSGGLSRQIIEQELDASLDRLGMDTLDLSRFTAGTNRHRSRRR